RRDVQVAGGPGGPDGCADGRRGDRDARADVQPHDRSVGGVGRRREPLEPAVPADRGVADAHPVGLGGDLQRLPGHLGDLDQHARLVARDHLQRSRHELDADRARVVAADRVRSGEDAGHGGHAGHSFVVRTILPTMSPAASAAKAPRTSSSEVRSPVRSTTGTTPAAVIIDATAASSCRVPIVDPTTRRLRKNTRLRSADGAGPLVAPATATTPPGRNERSECCQVASPTVSTTTSTGGTRVPVSTASCAPISRARSSFSGEREVTVTCSPAARASTVAAVATPPPAPCTSTRWPGCAWAAENSSR